MAAPAAVPAPLGCPRIVHSADGGRTVLRPCGHTLPCPYHGEPLMRVVPTPSGEAA